MPLPTIDEFKTLIVDQIESDTGNTLPGLAGTVWKSLVTVLHPYLDGAALTDPITIYTTSPLRIDGGASATLGSDRTLSILANGIDNTLLRDSAATSVIGRSAATVGDPADIVASADGDVLRRSGGVLGFGAIAQSSVTGLVADLASKSPLVHTHPESDITGLVADLASKSPLVHTHPESDITGLVADLAARPTGSGTTNTLPKWTAASALGDSSITDTGSLVTVNNPLTVTGATNLDSTLNVGGAVTLQSTLTLPLMTQGSILFAGAGGLVSQDNARLFWDDTNNRLGVGVSPSVGLHVKDSTAGGTSVIVEHSSTNGFAAINFHDSSAALAGGVGHANASITANTHVASKNYLYSPSADWVFANNTRNEVTVGMTSGSTYLQLQNGSSAAVSAASTGRLRYNTTGQKFQLSANAATYVDLVASSSAAVGVANTIPKWTAANAIGISLLTDNATTLAYNTNKFTVTAANGNTSIAGTLGVTGASTLTGGFTLGADSSANSHKITNLTNGSSAQDAAAFGQIGTAVSAAVSGAANTVAKFTSTNVVGNSSITDNGTIIEVTAAAGTSGGFSLKPSGSVAGSTTNLWLNGIRTDGSTPFAAIQIKPVMGAGFPSGLTIDTYDSSGSALTNNLISWAAITKAMTVPGAVTLQSTLTAVGSAYLGFDTGTGSKIFNVGRDASLSTDIQNGYSVSAWSDGNLYIDHKTWTGGSIQFRSGAGAASGANNGWMTVNPSGPTVTFPGTAVTVSGTLTVNGDTTLGNALTDNHTMNGRVIGNTSGFADGFDWTNTASAAAYSMTAIGGHAVGTFNTTAGARTAIAGNFSNTASRSAGANDLTNYAVYASATSGQVNYSFYGAAGDLYNAGNTTLGGADTRNFTVDTAGLVVARNDDNALVRHITLSNRGITAANQGSGILFSLAAGAATAEAAVAIDALSENTTHTGATADGRLSIKVALNSTLTERLLITSAGAATLTGSLSVSGNVALGDATSDAHALNGALTLNSTTASEGKVVVADSFGRPVWGGDGFIIVSKISNQAVTNAGVTDDSELVIHIVAGKTYAIEMQIIASGSDSAGDYAFRFRVDAGTMSGRGHIVSATTTDGIQTAVITAAAAANTNTISLGTASDVTLPVAVTVRYCFKASADGNFYFQFGNNATGVGRISRTFAGSYLRHKQLD